ncbi:Zn-ribbon domain-containing OB-fold protein [Nocardioides acrostichi]|uniref:OB-fold domain-containing protein n=1 Tax=Nocardioides acrostichi TaxID=2784339 RepID=A0A930Y8A0_9ACTN|nr:OB-fold domain-containing protein [Nocardioides acrostichi]MBF4162892.1 OB-fold domain-containing protein [Nocardioides acrostichi]
MTATPAIEGWFTTGDQPALIGERCTTCATSYFPPTAAAAGFCRNPRCEGTEFEQVELSRRGTVWSYTDTRYQPPPPYSAPEPFAPFGLAAVELPEGIVVLGQVAAGYGPDDLRVGMHVELVVEPEHTGEALIWRWKPLAEGSAA